MQRLIDSCAICVCFLRPTPAVHVSPPVDAAWRAHLSASVCLHVHLDDLSLLQPVYAMPCPMQPVYAASLNAWSLVPVPVQEDIVYCSVCCKASCSTPL